MPPFLTLTGEIASLESKISLSVSETLPITAATLEKSTRASQDVNVCSGYVSIEPALCAVRAMVVTMRSPDQQHQLPGTLLDMRSLKAPPQTP